MLSPLPSFSPPPRHTSRLYSDPLLLVSGINAQARRLQRVRAKGTPALASGGTRSPPLPRLRRTVSETSLSPAPVLSDTAQGPEEPGRDALRGRLEECPHLLLLQGYNPQHVSYCRGICWGSGCGEGGREVGQGPANP